MVFVRNTNSAIHKLLGTGGYAPYYDKLVANAPYIKITRSLPLDAKICGNTGAFANTCSIKIPVVSHPQFCSLIALLGLIAQSFENKDTTEKIIKILYKDAIFTPQLKTAQDSIKERYHAALNAITPNTTAGRRQILSNKL